LRNTRLKATGIAAVAALTTVAALSACSSSSSSSTTDSSTPATSESASASDSGTVAVDVANGTPIQLKKGPLHVGIFMNDNKNQWEQNVSGSAKKLAESFGWTADINDPGFDPQKQLSAIQTAITNKTYDAIVTVPVDGGLTCDAFTKKLPAANVLVTIVDVPMCGDFMAAGDKLRVPGTLTWVGGSGITAEYFEAWFKAGSEQFPGKQNVAIAVGPEVLTVTKTVRGAYANFQKTNSDFVITGWMNSDFTTPGTYQATLAYLKAHPDVTVVMSTYSPDMTRGVIQALKALGKKPGDIKVGDSGGAQYSADEIKSGYIQWTTPLYPIEAGTFGMQSIKDAQDGKTVPAYIPDIPASQGSLSNLPIYTSANIDQMKPEI